MPLSFQGLDLSQVTPDHFATEPERQAFSLGVLVGFQASIAELEPRHWAAALYLTRQAERRIRFAEAGR